MQIHTFSIGNYNGEELAEAINTNCTIITGTAPMEPSMEAPMEQVMEPEQTSPFENEFRTIDTKSDFFFGFHEIHNS